MISPRTIEIGKAVQGHNDRLAAANRALFDNSGVFVINVMSAPGSGKTEFLARTLRECAGIRPGLRSAVIVGDLATDNDARRLAATGAEAVQIVTGGYCHLDADMVAQAVVGIDLDALELLIIENVGNMVCPASFALGEHMRVALISVTEGEDKPLKYPTLFKRAEAIVLNKIDIAEVVGFDRTAALRNLHDVAPSALIFEVSARTGEGMRPWYDFLKQQVRDREGCYAGQAS